MYLVLFIRFLLLLNSQISFHQLLFKVDMRALFKTTSNWRQIIKINRIDLCLFFRGSQVLPFFKQILEIGKEMFPNLPTNCPIMPGDMYFMNVTVMMSPELMKSHMKLINSFTGSMLPNGIYRVTVRIFNDQDPQGIFFWYTSQINVRLNSELF